VKQVGFKEEEGEEEEEEASMHSSECKDPLRQRFWRQLRRTHARKKRRFVCRAWLMSCGNSSGRIENTESFVHCVI